MKKFDSNIMMMEMCMFSMRMCMCMPFSDELPSTNKSDICRDSGSFVRSFPFFICIEEEEKCSI